MMEDEEKPTTEANNVTAGASSHASSSQRYKLDAIFISEKQEKLDKLVD